MFSLLLCNKSHHFIVLKVLFRFHCINLFLQDWTEFFYRLLEPWYHYIPVDSDATEDQLQDLIEFAQNHQDEMETIAENGFEFIRDRLRMEDVECYWLGLIKSYAQKIDFKVELKNDFVEII